MRHGAWFRSTPPKAALLSVSLLLSACAQGGAYDATLSPAENELRQANRRFNQTMGEGAIIGALGGAALGAVLGGRNRAQGAAFGALAGGALGTAAGYGVANNNARQSGSEKAYNTAIQDARADAEVYRRSAVASRTIAQEAEAKLTSLNQQYSARQINAAQYNQQIARYRESLDILNQRISEAGTKSAQLRGAAGRTGGADAAALRASAGEIDAASAQIRADATRLSALMSSTPSSL